MEIVGSKMDIGILEVGRPRDGYGDDDRADLVL